MMSRYEQEENKRFSPFLIVVLILLLVAFAVWMYQKNKQVINVETKALDIPVEQTLATIDTAELPVADVTEQIDVKKNQTPGNTKELIVESGLKPKEQILELNDDGFRTKLEGVSEDLLYWFNVEGLIRKYILIINDLSQNQLVYKHVRFLTIPQKMVVKKDEQGLYLGSDGYRRFDRLANAIDAINVKKGLSLYLAFKPMFEKVYEEFAYPKEYSLEYMFMKASASVIKAPVIDTKIYLLKHTASYKYADKKLEALDAVDKQMLRMGPENTRKIQAKLRRLVEAISAIDQ